MNVIATYKGETIARGELRQAQFAFWHTVAVDETVDFERVVDRLRSIKETDRIHFEYYRPTRSISLPPAYKVERDDVLVTARLDVQS